MTGVENSWCPFIISPREHDERTQGDRQPPPAKPAGDPPGDEECRDGGDGHPEVELRRLRQRRVERDAPRPPRLAEGDQHPTPRRPPARAPAKRLEQFPGIVASARRWFSRAPGFVRRFRARGSHRPEQSPTRWLAITCPGRAEFSRPNIHFDLDPGRLMRFESLTRVLRLSAGLP
jgi:hypothetical protein